ncbi:MAG: hypothetical protein AUJ72_05485 [Candidatus Omnitrophica bacterium CG1_02_46_14]|nr:MAG: hypothetical protein AUJ72_05485 [Candidatus Omnitrophica bacterium CG1_02_46_14]
MTNLFTIFRRELSAYFNSAIAYIFLIVFILFANGLFMLQFFQIGKADMRMFFGALPFIFTIFIPAISMRLWAEDKKGNTYELLLTFPMKPHELVLGKFLASFVFYSFALVATFTIPVMLHFIGHADPGMISGGYLSALLMGGVFLAMGIFISGLCKDQIVAFILTVLASFVIFFVGTTGVASTLDGWIGGFGTFVKNYIGLADHLNSLSKGVIDMKDVIYFVIVASVFLFLNGLSLEGRFRPKARLVFSSAVAVCAVAAVLVNWLIHDLPLGRFDTTEGQMYTISGASAKILKNLKIPVQVKLYISPVDAMPTALKTLEREVTDKLDELKVASDGMLKYRVITLEPSYKKEDASKENLKSQGVVPFQIESVQKDEVGVKLIYSTLVIEYKEKPAEIIPRIVPQTIYDLEYQLMSRIFKMTLENRPKVAIFAPAKGEALPEDLNKLLSESGQKDQKDYRDEFKTAGALVRNNGYEMSRIALTKDDPIPDKTKTLLLLNPGKLTDRQRYEINRFLYQGGTVVLAAQGFKYTYAHQETGIEAVPEKLDLDINKLIEKWGVKINENILLDENSQVISLTSGQRIGPFAIEMPVKIPNQIVVSEATINRSAPITNRLPSLAYLWGSALDVSENIIKDKNIKSTVLFTSSEKSWTTPNNGSNLSAVNTLPPQKDIRGKYPLAVELEGQFTDTFDSAPPAWSDGDKSEPKKMDAPKPGRLLIVGCSQAFSEDLIQNPGNLNLFANIIDGLVLGEDLIKIRSKTGFVRDIKNLSNAEKIWFKFFTVALIPLILFLAALGRLFIRKKEKEFYLAAITGKS